MQPKYQMCKYIKGSEYNLVTSDNSQTARIIRLYSHMAITWTHVNLDQLIRGSTVTREEAIRKLQHWHDVDAIELQLSQVIHRFRIAGHFPNTQKESDQLIEDLYDEMKAREQDNIDRIKAVIDLVTSGGCLSRKLAKHFGDEKSVPEGGCGHCQHCIMGVKIKFEYA